MAQRGNMRRLMIVVGDEPPARACETCTSEFLSSLTVVKQLMALVTTSTSATVAVTQALTGGDSTALVPAQAGAAAVRVRLGVTVAQAVHRHGERSSARKRDSSVIDAALPVTSSVKFLHSNLLRLRQLRLSGNVRDDVSSACDSQCGMKKNTNPKNVRYTFDGSGAVVPDPRSTSFCCIKCSGTPGKHDNVCELLAVGAGGGVGRDTIVYQV